MAASDRILSRAYLRLVDHLSVFLQVLTPVDGQLHGLHGHSRNFFSLVPEMDLTDLLMRWKICAKWFREVARQNAVV
jgi:hypothetical protein